MKHYKDLNYNELVLELTKITAIEKWEKGSIEIEVLEYFQSRLGLEAVFSILKRELLKSGGLYLLMKENIKGSFTLQAFESLWYEWIYHTEGEESLLDFERVLKEVA